MPEWDAKPQVVFRFPVPTKIAASEFINSRIQDDRSPNIEFRSGAVYLDGRNIWRESCAS
jgi:hypothetical protein